jgi:peptide/nickel transport system permease protein
VLRGLLRLLVLAACVVCLSWAAGECAPGDVRERAARAAGLLPAEGVPVSSALRARALAAVATFGVPEGPGARLAALGSGLLRGDLRSWRDGQPVYRAVARALPWTLILVILALVLSILAGGAGAAWAATRAGRGGDALVRILASLGLALPTAWLAVIALRTLVWGHPFALVVPGLEAGLADLVLPAACLGIFGAALVARTGRAALVEALARPELTAARARGIGGARLLLRHALPLAAAPLAATLPVLVAALLGGATVVERAFDLPGLGALLTTAAQRGDVPTVTVCALTSAIAVGLAGLLARGLTPVRA